MDLSYDGLRDALCSENAEIRDLVSFECEPVAGRNHLLRVWAVVTCDDGSHTVALVAKTPVRNGSDHVLKETRLCKAMWERGCKVPRVHAIDYPPAGGIFEWCPGKTLGQWARRHTDAENLELFERLCRDLAACHAVATEVMSSVQPKPSVGDLGPHFMARFHEGGFHPGEEEAREIRLCCSRIQEACAGFTHLFQHADLLPKHVLADDGGRSVIIDFEMSQWCRLPRDLWFLLSVPHSVALLDSRESRLRLIDVYLERLRNLMRYPVSREVFLLGYDYLGAYLAVENLAQRCEPLGAGDVLDQEAGPPEAALCADRLARYTRIRMEVLIADVLSSDKWMRMLSAALCRVLSIVTDP